MMTWSLSLGQLDISCIFGIILIYDYRIQIAKGYSY